MKQGLVAEILALPVEERLQLVEAIWDSISSVPEALPLADLQKEELDRRLAEFEADPDARPPDYMIRKFILRARTDIQSAFEGYESRSARLGEQYLSAR